MSPRLLIFAKYPRAGRVKTRLAPHLSHEMAAMLYRAFLLDALGLYASLAPDIEPVLYLTDRLELEEMRDLLRGSAGEGILIRVQRGDGLGERLEAAFEDAFADGCDAACAIGTDHPTLPLEHVRRAFDAVAHSGEYDLAVGPADDGGYYLIALNASHPELFRGMPYSTADLYEATIAAADAAGLRRLELPVWYDVDDAGSLRRLIADRGLLAAGSHTAAVLGLLEKDGGGRDLFVR